MRARIRNMTKEDIDQVGEVLYEAFCIGATEHGYAPKMRQVETGKSWAWSMLRYGSNELIIADIDSRIAGICCLSPRGELGGVGPVVVNPQFQGCRIGGQLMDTLLDRASNQKSLRLVQEAFNTASFSLFYSCEFLPVATLLDLYRDGNVVSQMEKCRYVSQLNQEDLDEVNSYDSQRSQSDRRKDLSYCIKWGKVFVYRYKSQIRGFLACIPGSASVQLGPLVAEGEEEAKGLFQNAVEAFSGQLCQTRLMARDYFLSKYLKELGFKVYCLNNLMVRGAWRPSQYIEAFGIFPEGI